MMACWINTVCLDHVEIGRRDGIAQADHGRFQRLARLSRGDGLVFYSPRTSLRSREPVQAFTAIGSIADDECHQVELHPGFRPWRRFVDYAAATPAPIRDLLPRLTFTRDRAHWGLVFRRGLFEIDERDFAIIAEAMGVDTSGARPVAPAG